MLLKVEVIWLLGANAVEIIKFVMYSNYFKNKYCPSVEYPTGRVGHGLGPSMGWVGLGQSFFNFWWVGWRLDCVIFLTS